MLNESGEARDIVCVYHNWSYDLCGNLTGVAFRKGLRGKGGMPPDCRPEAHGPRKLKLETLAGLVFGTLSADTPPPLERYRGAEIVARIRRVMRAPVKLLGDYSQMLPSNWKLYMENVKDTYPASLLHTFSPLGTIRRSRLLGLRYTLLWQMRHTPGQCPCPAARIFTPKIRSPPPMIEQCDARPSISCHPDSGGPTAQTWVEVWVGLELWLAV